MQSQPKGSRAQRFPRRIVQCDGKTETVLEEFHSEAATGKAVHEALCRHAAKAPGCRVEAQWLGPLGWTTFLRMAGPTTNDPSATGSDGSLR